MTINQLESNVRQVIRQQIDNGTMTVSLLARISGYGQPHMSAFLHGRRRLSVEALSCVLVAIGYDVQVMPRAVVAGRRTACKRP